MHWHHRATVGILLVAQDDVAAPLMMYLETQPPQGVDDFPRTQQGQPGHPFTRREGPLF